MIRKPLVAGQFYSAYEEELKEQIKESFLSKHGPNGLPGKRADKKIKGVIVPHAGYMFSGPAAAFSFKEIAKSEFPDLYIILGNSHSYFGESCYCSEDWETPLGNVKTDKEFNALLKKNGIKEDDNAHSTEHSIEVQIPFLQFVSKDNIDKLRIAAVIITEDYEAAAEKIKKAIKEYGKKIVIIASSDFTHYGVSYGYIPFVSDVKEKLHELDKKAIEFIEKTDSFGLVHYTEETGATICGKYSIACLLELLRGSDVKLLTYYTSGDIVKDYSNAVGYAAIEFY